MKTLDTEPRLEPLHCIIGFGRIGSVTARLLKQRGIRVRVYDVSERHVEAARREGFEARLVDITSEAAAARIAAECDVAATALPSRVAEEAIPLLIDNGIPAIVDVSYVRDPLALRDPATKKNVKLFVDAGFAPGLSNILVGHASTYMDRVREIFIYVGGISASPSALLGLVASWSVEDLLEEYTRKARAIVSGRKVLLDPIEDAKRVELPGIGVFDAMPTDGLRTLLESYSEVTNMVEYTLRYPGHVELLKTLRDIGLLEAKPISIAGCSLEPRRLLAHLLEERLERRGDRIILRVEVYGEKGGLETTVSYTLTAYAGKGQAAETVLALATGAVHAFTARLAGEGYGHPGVVKPEELGYDEKVFSELTSYLRGLGLVVREERTFRRSL